MASLKSRLSQLITIKCLRLFFDTFTQQHFPALLDSWPDKQYCDKGAFENGANSKANRTPTELKLTELTGGANRAKPRANRTPRANRELSGCSGQPFLAIELKVT